MPKAWRAIAPAISPAPRSNSPRIADADPPSALFAGTRARNSREAPPGPDWEPVNALEESRRYAADGPSQIGAASAIFYP